MAETFHIFDEFLMPESDITDEQRHQKRTRLEPLVFNILQHKYGKLLQDSFLTNSPVKNSKKCLLIVERRVHENLEFILHNCAYFGKDWSICFICSDTNLEYCKTICSPWQDSVHFMPIFQGSLTGSRDSARNDYNSLMKNADFWDSLPWEMICVVQMDSYFLRRIPEKVCNYDFIAAVASWDLDSMVGGMSFRRPKLMAQICRDFKEDISSEDCFLNKGAKALGFRIPEFPESLEYITESCFYEDPIGTHQWWTYLFKETDNYQYVFNNLLHFHIL